jgi:hypothetical protein
MDQTIINQPAGRHAAKLARLAAVRVLAAGVFALGVALLALTHVRWAMANPAGGIALGLCLLGALIAAERDRVAFYRARIGARSERRVAKVLASTQPVALANSLLLGAGGDADHVIIGPHLAVVETKTGRGPVTFSHGRLRVGERYFVGDPIRQVTRQAAAVHRLTGVHTAAIVCIVDATTPPFTQGSTTICSLDDLPQVLTRQPKTVHDETDARLLYEKLLRQATPEE